MVLLVIGQNKHLKGNKMSKETRSFSEIIEDISSVLAECDGDYLAGIAGNVLGKSVEYHGDSIFEVEE